MFHLRLFSITLLCCSVQAAKILVFLPLATWSHYMQYELLYETLAAKGHQITMYSPYPPKQNMSNLEHVFINSQVFEDIMREYEPFKEFRDMKWFLLDAYETFGFSKLINREILTHKTFHQLIKSKQTFDLVMIEPFFCQEATLLLGHILQAPVIHMGATGPHPGLLEAMGAPNEVSFMPELYSYLSDEMTLLERVQNLHYSVIRYVFRRAKDWSLDNLIAETLGPGLPLVGSLFRNISFCFLYSVAALEYPYPLTSNMVRVGGMHIQRNRTITLPEDLKKSLDDAKDGFILFSLGSVITPTTMPPSLGRTFMSAFSKLAKYKIIWKWSGEPLSGLPSNVLQLKWVPQIPVLAHPNCKLFITHGGLSSQLETVFFGVPVVTIPFFGDQFHSATKAEKFGFGVTLRNTNLTAESLVWALSEVLTKPSYKQKVLERSDLMREWDKSPIDTAVYWTEYLLQHKGAAHLSPVSRDLYWFQYYLLDVLAAILSILVGIGIIGKKIVEKLCGKRKSVLKNGKKVKNKKE